MKFIGMDAHSQTCTFVVLGKSGKVLQKATVKTQEDRLLAVVRSIKGRKKLAFEEGVMAQWLYLLLKDEVEELVVCCPTERKSGPKTDEIDAGEIADLLRVGRLKSVFHADTDLMRMRTLVSGYGDVIEELGRTKNRYKALYRQVAISTAGAAFYTSKEMLSQLDDDARRHVARALFEQIALLEKHRARYMGLFASNARKHKEIKLLMSIPGIAFVRANQIAAVMVTPHRFPTKYDLISYAKLTKHKCMSGGKQYGTQRAQGVALLKEVFKSAALSATQGDNTFSRKYDAMRAAGKEDRVARHAVAKKIAATVRAVWKSGKKYDDKYEEVMQRRNRNDHSGR